MSPRATLELVYKLADQLSNLPPSKPLYKWSTRKSNQPRNNKWLCFKKCDLATRSRFLKAGSHGRNLIFISLRQTVKQLHRFVVMKL